MKITTLCTAALLLLAAAGLAQAQDKTQDKRKAAGPQTEVKEISGMSIVGNNETPKSLTIVPWKSSEIGKSTDFRSSLLDNQMEPVNKDVFLRELNFYNLSNAK